MKSMIWKPINGIFITCPPISCRLHILLFWCLSSSEDTTKPLFQSRYLIVIEDGVDSPRWEFRWIAGLYHFVQTRKAKHSAILQHNIRGYSNRKMPPEGAKNHNRKMNVLYPKFMNKSHQPRAATSPACHWWSTISITYVEWLQNILLFKVIIILVENNSEIINIISTEKKEYSQTNQSSENSHL